MIFLSFLSLREMVVHHIITLFLLFLSYTSNFVRVGSLVLLTHDVADGILELAKLCKYAKRDRLCDVVFGVFTVVWVATRQVGKVTLVQSEEVWHFLENRSALLMKRLGKVVRDGI